MSPGEPQSAPADRMAVLLVDDEPAFLDAMRQALGGEFAFATATSAAAAEDLLAARPFAVLICDQVMPGEAGLDFLIRMRERYPQTRRIMLTGYINPELLSRSMRIAELSACLLKPVGAASLAMAVRATLDH
jgi:two-component system response regulator HupR/HoxA